MNQEEEFFEFTIELYDGVVLKRLVAGREELVTLCEQLEDDCDVIWWDYEEV